MQNDIDVTVCVHCGTALPAPIGRDDERGDLEVIEIERAVGSLGFDAEFRVDGDVVHCPECGGVTNLADANIQTAQRAVDTANGASDNEVVTLTCSSCGTTGHAVVPLPDEG
jgi:hypothetical protein